MIGLSLNDMVLAKMQREMNSWILGQSSISDCYHDSLNKRLDGTCEWIFQRPEFNTWTSQSLSQETKPILWINGHAGFGKTVLCARIVEYFSSTSDAPVAYFFFASELASSDDAYFALRSLVSQLASRDAEAFEVVCQKWSDMTDHTTAPRVAVVQMLKEILKAISGCTLVIDGLDECTAKAYTPSSVSSLLHDISKCATDDTRIMIVSRDEPEIRQTLAYDLSDRTIEIKISVEDVRADTAALSNHLVNRKLPKKSEDIRSDLSLRMSQRCDGQFLWLTMQEPLLRRGMSNRELQNVINDFPTGIEQIYDRNWNTILHLSERDKCRAFALLRWTAFALRPLTVSEISEAVLVDEDDEEFPVDGLPDCVDDDYVDTEILGLCGPLLEIRDQAPDQWIGNKLVHLAHFTVKEYLVCHLPIKNLQSNEDLRRANERVHNTMLARLCLTYVQSKDSWGDLQPKYGPGFQRIFRNYAASAWHLHLLSGAESLGVDPEALSFAFDFMISVRVRASWSNWRRWFYDNDRDEDAKIEMKALMDNPLEKSGALYDAVRLGLYDLALRLINNQGDLTVEDHSGAAFHLACRRGNKRLAEAFLDANSHIETPGLEGRTPLISAVLGGKADVVQLLIDRGADVSARTTQGCTALIRACLMGFVDIAELLIQNGADVMAVDYLGFTPFLAAADRGHLNLMRLLLENAADHSSRAKNGDTPLIRAAAFGHVEVVKFLIENGASIHETTFDGWTAFHASVEGAQLEMMRFLQQEGADIYAPNTKGTSPMGTAAHEGHLDALRWFQEQGADFSASDDARLTPLVVAVKGGHLDIARWLHTAEADASIRDDPTLEPFLATAYTEIVEIVALLLNNGADASTRSNKGDPPWIEAASNGRIDLLEFMLNEGTDIETTTYDMWTGLHAATEGGFFDTMKFLHSKGANVSARTITGYTPISTAAALGYLDIVRWLLEAGADHGEKDIDHQEPLKNAAFSGHLEVVRLLLESGADVSVKCILGWTPLSAAASGGYTEVVQLLLDNGAEVATVTNSFATELVMERCAANQGEKYMYLLDQYADTQTSEAPDAVEPGVISFYPPAPSPFEFREELGFSTRGVQGCSPLHLALREGHLSVIRLLLDKGSSVTARRGDGWEPVHIASDRGFLEVLQLLLDRGADACAVDEEGNTPLALAAAKGRITVFETLLGNGASVSAMNDNLQTPLFAAARHGHREAVSYLLANDSEIAAAAIDGVTPLHAAAANGHLDVVAMLLAHGATSNTADNDGFTPLEAARERGHLEMVELLA